METWRLIHLIHHLVKGSSAVLAQISFFFVLVNRAFSLKSSFSSAPFMPLKTPSKRQTRMESILMKTRVLRRTEIENLAPYFHWHFLRLKFSHDVRYSISNKSHRVIDGINSRKINGTSNGRLSCLLKYQGINFIAKNA